MGRYQPYAHTQHNAEQTPSESSCMPVAARYRGAGNKQIFHKNDLVYDPFGGLMTVPYMAVKMGRRGYGCELNPDYFRDGVGYLEAAEAQIGAPTLFDLMEGA